MLNKPEGQSDKREAVVIKKYANRRLYNTETSTYVTLDDLAQMVRSDRDFVVYDAKTGDDLTHTVLTQIIVEQEGREGGQTLLPIPFLRQLIRFYDDSIGKMVPSYLQFSLETLAKEQEKFRNQFANAFGNPAAAFEAYQEQVGVCRDFTHLAITFCRCMNIPARYCTGYLGDIGVPIADPMDFSAWFEVYLDDQWYTFDSRNNIPRIGRVLMASGRDAADVALLTSFGPSRLDRFTVWTYEVGEEALAPITG